jgi:hypothetical protein
VNVETLKESCVAGCSGVELEVVVEVGWVDGVVPDAADRERDAEGDLVAVQPAQTAASTRVPSMSTTRRALRVVTAPVSRVG